MITVKQMAVRLGLTNFQLIKMIKSGALPGPDLIEVTEAVYSGKMEPELKVKLNRLRAEEAQQKQKKEQDKKTYSKYHLMQTQKVSEELIQKLADSGTIPQPDLVLPSGHKRWSAKVIEPYFPLADQIVVMLSKQVKSGIDKRAQKTSKTLADRLRALGLYSIGHVAKLAGVSPLSVQHHLRKGRFPRPNHKVDWSLGNFWTEKEIQPILEYYKRTYNSAARIAGRKKRIVKAEEAKFDREQIEKKLKKKEGK